MVSATWLVGFGARKITFGWPGRGGGIGGKGGGGSLDRVVDGPAPGATLVVGPCAPVARPRCEPPPGQPVTAATMPPVSHVKKSRRSTEPGPHRCTTGERTVRTMGRPGTHSRACFQPEPVVVSVRRAQGCNGGSARRRQPGGEHATTAAGLARDRRARQHDRGWHVRVPDGRRGDRTAPR